MYCSKTRDVFLSEGWLQAHYCRHIFFLNMYLCCVITIIMNYLMLAVHAATVDPEWVDGWMDILFCKI